jgi:type IV pilus assembly protein PilC
MKGFDSKYTRTIDHFLGFTLASSGTQGKPLMTSPIRRRRTSAWNSQNTSKSSKNISKNFIFNFSPLRKSIPKVSITALEAWTRQLAHLLQGGVALSKALGLIRKTRKINAVASLSEQVERKIMQGLSFSQSLQGQPGVDAGFIQLVAAGENSGTLPLQMERLADQLARQLALRRQLVSALAYPVVVLHVSLLVVVALLWWVVPSMAQLFSDMGAQLPAATQAVLSASHWLQTTGPWMATGLLLVGLFMGIVYRQSAAVRLQLDRALLRLPAWGRLRRLHQQSQWAYSLSTLLQARIPLVDALRSCALASSAALAHDTEAARQQVIEGQSLSQALEAAKGFDGLLVEMARVGEESGLLGPLLFKAAQSQEAELSAWISRLTALVEPAMVLVLGAVIGGVVLAMYLPMFQMGQLF